MTIAEQLTRAKADLDAVYEAGKAAGGGGGNRREYSGTVAEEVKGNTVKDFAPLCQDTLLAEKRESATLFVRVEFATKDDTYLITKNWASNVNGEVFPVAYTQLVYRLGGGGTRTFGTLTKTLYDEVDSTAVGVGLLHITTGGELRIYSGSPNYKIQKDSTYKVIVEW